MVRPGRARLWWALARRGTLAWWPGALGPQCGPGGGGVSSCTRPRGGTLHPLLSLTLWPCWGGVWCDVRAPPDGVFHTGCTCNWEGEGWVARGGRRASLAPSGPGPPGWACEGSGTQGGSGGILVRATRGCSDWEALGGAKRAGGGLWCAGRFSPGMVTLTHFFREMVVYT